MEVENNVDKGLMCTRRKEEEEKKNNFLVKNKVINIFYLVLIESVGFIKYIYIYIEIIGHHFYTGIFISFSIKLLSSLV